MCSSLSRKTNICIACFIKLREAHRCISSVWVQQVVAFNSLSSKVPAVHCKTCSLHFFRRRLVYVAEHLCHACSLHAIVFFAWLYIRKANLAGALSEKLAQHGGDHDQNILDLGRQICSAS